MLIVPKLRQWLKSSSHQSTARRNDLRQSQSSWLSVSRQRNVIETLEDRTLLASDFGDAPDPNASTGTDNYQTLATSNGPSHVIDTTRFTLFLGNSVDGDSGSLQNDRASADDVDTALPDDEDGVLNSLDLLGIIGAAPVITLLATNTTGSAATLSGWIDYNQDGVFDNVTERAQATVATNTTDGRFTLTFPVIPTSSAGTTYVRFRLSTDAAAQNSTGTASDGEVEDYVFSITSPSGGALASTVEINSSTANGPALSNFGEFGSSVVSLGDLDGDGVTDLAVGARFDNEGGGLEGAVHVLFLNADGSVKQTVGINANTANGPALAIGDRFGSSIASLGDVDGDGVIELAVGAPGDDEGGTFRGAVHVLFLNVDGSVKQTVEFNSSTVAGLTLENYDYFGMSVASLGDLDGDGVTDLAVGASGDDGGGAMHVLFLNADGSVKQTAEINSNTANGPTLGGGDQFGSSVASLGDLDGDGVIDLAVGARRDDAGGYDRGAVHLLLLNSDGSVKQTVEINSNSANGPLLADNDYFGSSVASLGDLDGDGVIDLAVGARRDDEGGRDRGAMHVLLLNADGSVKQTVEINSSTAHGPRLTNFNNFGGSVASLGDLNGDGVNDIAVGSPNDNEGGSYRGTVHVMFLASLPPPADVDYGDAPDTGAGTGVRNYETIAANGGPSHVVVAGLHMGASVDGDSGTLQNGRANADDVYDALPGDEDGVLNSLDLLGTAGSAPTVTLLVTNMTGSAAGLVGWIDYNQDGVFDNSTERAVETVPAGTIDGRVTLVFPKIPSGLNGETYARFRLSTDEGFISNPAATGAASDGEVEDYTFTITRSSTSTLSSFLKINSSTTNGPNLADSSEFGSSVTSLGDLDGDGVTDLAVGDSGFDTAGGFNGEGAVHVLFLNADGSVKRTVRIDATTTNGPTLASGDRFGSSVASLGDLDGDGVTDLAVGALGDDSGGTVNRGAVHILFLTADGSVKQTAKIATNTANGPTLANHDLFGSSVASLGDLDGDGVIDLAVGAEGAADGGMVHVLFLDVDGSVKRTVVINSSNANSPAISNFTAIGSSVASLGDLDGDGVTDLAVGDSRYDTEGGVDGEGAVHVLFLNADGSVKQTAVINSSSDNGPTLASYDSFGTSVASLGDLDGDGVTDLAVGADGNDTGGDRRGAAYILLLNADGSVKRTEEFNSSTDPGPALVNFDYFGTSVASLGDLNGDGTTDFAVGARGDGRGAIHVLFLTPQPVDYGDAPDTRLRTSTGNYQTTFADSGPSHQILAGLHLGARVDGDDGTLQNSRANADDVDGSFPNDEDGVLGLLDLVGTEGATPSITLLATNTSGETATLSGWIDYNQDGVFDNATERAQTTVSTGTTDGRVTLTFPAIPNGAAGTTYARFRFSTDEAAENSTGPASDGEVEDYVFTITSPAGLPVTVAGFLKIAHETSGGPMIADNGNFGRSIANIGDVDGDGVTDLAVGAAFTESGSGKGEVHVLLLNSDGTVKSSTKIANNIGGGPTLENFDFFGSSVTGAGDLDGDGIPDLVVGASGDDTGGNRRGAMYILFLNSNGSVKQFTKIASDTGGGPTLADNSKFGGSSASVGDLNGDGVSDLVVGAAYDNTNGSNRGAVHVLFMNHDSSVKSSIKIASGTNGGPTLADGDRFGTSVTGLGDLDGDGVGDIAVGAFLDDTGGSSRGAVHVLLLNSDGTVNSSTKIASNTGGGPTLVNNDQFGVSVGGLGDLDGDGVPDLAVGAGGDDTGGSARGALHVLLLNSNGSVRNTAKIASQTSGGPALTNTDYFGTSVTNVGDLDGDGVTDLAVGALMDDTGGSSIFANRGAVYILKLAAPPRFDFGDAPDTGTGTGPGNYETTDSDGGPKHTVVSNLFLGNTVDGFEDGTLQNHQANADDAHYGFRPDDEDGVLNPLDLLATEGTAPAITLLVTNTTGSTATLAGWIDYNRDGRFDNATERATATVDTGSTDARVTLTFPEIPRGAAGRTYARFRLSTDAAFTTDPTATGAASDGEVEDHVFTITAPAAPPVSISSFSKIASDTSGGPTLAFEDFFGKSVAHLGDLDGDGVDDIAVGSYRDRNEGFLSGAVYVLFLNADGTVQRSTKIASNTGGGPQLSSREYFGRSLANVGDLDGDGVPDLAVGASGDSTGPSKFSQNPGAIYILFLNRDGTAKNYTQITSDTNGGPTLGFREFFGSAIAGTGDINGDGVPDLAVGGSGAGGGHGAVHMLFLNSDGTAKSSTRIQSPSPNELFGSSVVSLGDIDGDGVIDLAVGAPNANTNGVFNGAIRAGAVYVLRLNVDGTLKSSTRIGNGENGGPNVRIGSSRLGNSIANVGDLDGDGVNDLAVGDPASDRLYIHLLNRDGTVKSSIRKRGDADGLPTIVNGDEFGSSMTNMGDLNGDGLPELVVGAVRDGTGTVSGGSVYILYLEAAPFVAETQLDFGDAPDTGAGTGPLNYQTTATDGGPSHMIGPDLFLGATVDGREDGTLQNLAASADDEHYWTWPDDEDGVLDPLDLTGTEGVSATITLLATNTTGEIATLTGWIDYDHDGRFDNSTERSQVTVESGTTKARVSLTFPPIPLGTAGQTYVRFRLSTDPAGETSIGAASDGEVEDYRFTITAPADQPTRLADTSSIASETNGGPLLLDRSNLGSSVANIGDWDGDGIPDLAAGASGINNFEGAVYLFLMNRDGSVKELTTLDNDTENISQLNAGDFFGTAMASPGDLNGDGVVDLAVGARGNDGTSSDQGAVHVLLMNADRSVKADSKITSGFNGGPVLNREASFGSSLTALGDLDGDGVPDLVVGAYRDESGGASKGAIYVLLMNPNGTAKTSVRIASTTNGGPTLSNLDRFGISVAAMGDLDGDGVIDLAVGASGDDTGGLSSSYNRGAVHILYLNSDGTVKNATKIASETGGGPSLNDRDFFGSSVANAGDLDGDGITDLAVGAIGDDTGGSDRGAVYLLLMNADGTVKSNQKIANETNGGPQLTDFDHFGSSITNVGDLDADGVAELTVGARFDDTGGSDRGAVYVLFPGRRQRVTVDLPVGGGSYEITRDGSDLVVQAAGGGSQLLRKGTEFVSELAITGTANADIVRVLNNGGTVSTPILFIGKGGDDVFDASAATASTTLIGGNGDDTLTGGTDDDLIIAGNGNDVVSGGDGNDHIIGQSGRDTLTGGSGNDTIRGGKGRDELEGDQGDDVLLGGGGQDTINGSEGADVLAGGAGPDTISGGDGTDRIRGGSGQDLLDGDDGDDTLFDGSGQNDLAGGLGNDTLNGVFRNDAFSQVIGRDTLTGGQRPAPRPAPVDRPVASKPAPDAPMFLNVPTDSDAAGKDTAEQIDRIFIEPLLPELLEL